MPGGKDDKLGKGERVGGYGACSHPVVTSSGDVNGGPEQEHQLFLPVVLRHLPPIIPDTTVVLTEASTQYLVGVSPDGSVYTFSQINPELGQVQQGDVIVTGIAQIRRQVFCVL